MAETSRRAARGRMGLVTVDQVLSSASNLLVLLWTAHALAPIDFGRFSLVFLIYSFAQGAVVRSLVSWTVMAHPEDARQRPRAVLGTAVVLSLAAGLLCLAAGAALVPLDNPVAVPLLVVGAVLPLLSVQDVGRYLAFAQGRPSRAIVLDTLWLLLVVAAFGALAWSGTVSLTGIVLAWGVAGAVAGLWVFVQHGVPRRREVTLTWLRGRWHFSWRSLVAASSSATVALVGALLVALISGPLAVAAVRAALLLERPSTTVQTAVATSAGADIARERSDNAGLLAHQRRALLVALAVAAVNFAVLMVLPDAVGRLVLGNVWDLVEPLLLVVSLRVLAMAAQSGVRAALMGRRQIGVVMVLDIVGTALSIVGLVVGAALGDGEGALWGALVGLSLTVVGWWAALVRHLREGDTYPTDVLDADESDPEADPQRLS
ncbi:hypothetical protein KUV85_16690 [Nocardioides panacisoli]|uniref:hypothetical protein n=1 Tax=Nocardioides panacisoli TaxID=627624 RepID=UPI001C6313D1|nr:hypothetical protein [Nocardioides panacisoli]QYJ03937.1 hypothetical protein KUV85_16690 [Nocardioides panacisoli]